MSEQFLDIEGFNLNSDIERASELLDRIAILAVQAARFQEGDKNNLWKVFTQVYPEANDINEELQEMPNLRYRFAGKGFIPVKSVGMPTRTTFANVDEASGRYYDLTMFDASEVDYTTRSQILEESGIGEESDSEDEEQSESNFDDGSSVLINPPTGVRLYLDFLIARSLEYEQPIGGISLRSNETRTHYIMDAESLNTSFVYEQSDEKFALPLETVHHAINEGSDDLKRMITDTRFRRMSLSLQKKAIESHITNINDQVMIHRFDAFVNPEQLYYMEVSSGSREMYSHIIDKENMSVMIRPIRLDSIELYDITQGQRIFSDQCLYSKYDGLCIVAEADFGFESKIVWLPISSQDSDLTLFPKSLEL